MTEEPRAQFLGEEGEKNDQVWIPWLVLEYSEILGD